jgi:hypothetical protein
MPSWFGNYWLIFSFNLFLPWWLMFYWNLDILYFDLQLWTLFTFYFNCIPLTLLYEGKVDTAFLLPGRKRSLGTSFSLYSQQWIAPPLWVLISRWCPLILYLDVPYSIWGVMTKHLRWIIHKQQKFTVHMYP